MIISKWRKYLNDVLIPNFENKIFENKIGVKKAEVLDIGQSTTWDYKPFFTNSEFIVSDINENCGRDVVIDDIRETKFEPNSFDGIIFNGVYEQIKLNIGEGAKKSIFNVFENIEKILKKDGLLLFGAPGVAFPRYGKDRDTGRRLFHVSQAIGLIIPLRVLEVKTFYSEKGLQYIYI